VRRLLGKHGGDADEVSLRLSKRNKAAIKQQKAAYKKLSKEEKETLDAALMTLDCAGHKRYVTPSRVFCFCFIVFIIFVVFIVFIVLVVVLLLFVERREGGTGRGADDARLCRTHAVRCVTAVL
jgi:Flp pilus assembly protein TadB